MMIRTTTFDDVGDLHRVLEATGLFPAGMLAAMIAESERDGRLWLSCESEGRAVGFCFCTPETLAEGTWNMTAIAVHPGHQGRGAGSALVAQIEERLRQRRQRILIVDTSGTDTFAATRKFYRRNGYVEAAVIKDFWAVGDDKVIFWKSLTL